MRPLVHFSNAQFLPKVFLANERTLMHWLHTGMLILTLSLALMHLDHPALHLTGMFLSPIALFLFLYPYMKYCKRAEAITNQVPTDWFYDVTGPAVVVTAFSLAILSSSLINIYYKVSNFYRY
eukprot:Platyproteum_vivax@DN15863_c0_g1_i1.p1